MGRIQGNNLLRNCKTRQKQMRYLLENMKEPNFAMIESNDTLDNAFNLAPHNTLNTAGITWRILNSQGFGNGAHRSDTKPSWGSVANFMAQIQDYLPDELRTKQNPYRLWSRWTLRDNDTQIIADETRELLDDMVDWLEVMKRKIMDYITARYFREGKLQYCEILKRRFKDQYSEKVEQEVVADVVADTKVNIVIEDYDSEDD
jgi:hypothetical protein